MQYTLNVGGQLLDLSQPRVMGILNVTPDSFYADSRKQTEEAIRQRTQQILDEGGDIIDIGAYSTRPGAAAVSQAEEMQRLRQALPIVRQVASETVLSVDTFRADVARMCVEEFGVAIVNDVTGGQQDAQMFSTVARLGTPYVLTHSLGTASAMQHTPQYDDLLKEVQLYFAERIQQLRDLGQKDIVLDPGFGFGKTLEHNYQLLNHLDLLKIFNLPILVGFSRKSMISKLLNITSEESLGGTIVCNTIALTKGCAQMLRVHDVRAAVETVKIMKETMSFS